MKSGNERLVEGYPKEIEEFLNMKYEKEFIVNPKFFVASGSPIPFAAVNAPYEYRVHEECEDKSIFKAYVYPESVKDKK